MEKQKIIKLLKDIRKGRISIDEAFAKLRRLPYEDLGFAKVDHHRSIRSGLPEVVFCQGKRPEQVTAIFKSLSRENSRVLLTRADEKLFKKINKVDRRAKYNPLARTICLDKSKSPGKGLVGVVCAGTADTAWAEEAAVTAEIFGARVERIYDVGVAGLHRLLDCFVRISEARCIVVLAGMDGVLPSVIGGLASCPVIAVPTSVGYGANFGGVAALLTMLNSCAPNVSVVNINNGFGAGYIASMINGASK
jgi:NCAIR mutase (PurE)-related protein